VQSVQQSRQEQVAAQRPASGVVNPGLLNMRADYGRRLEREEGEHAEQLRLAETLVAEKRDELMEATRERRTFEILRERAEAAHKKQARRQERVLLDEVGGQLHLRRQRAGEAELEDDESAIGGPGTTDEWSDRWH
jgi:flagellar export protein FliJ